jgi:hypothetical protein
VKKFLRQNQKVVSLLLILIDYVSTWATKFSGPLCVKIRGSLTKSSGVLRGVNRAKEMHLTLYKVNVFDS